ncbi:hypothetical protein EYF80_017219 [Liparis tanakae]|uniref:Uncharacterized protein n=1 Tax=Liparis tanakae TaxID=230148 RepID=A0A4Z2I5R0_9TELE|nr:hypothetical protein EYF80_017219 [Liparis tanakae]
MASLSVQGVLVRLFLFWLLLFALLLILWLLRILLQLLGLSCLSHLLLCQLPPPLSLSLSILLFVRQGVLGYSRYCGLLVFLKMKLGCNGSCLRLLGCRLLFWLSGIRHPVQGLPQLLVSIHLRLTGTTCTVVFVLIEQPAVVLALDLVLLLQIKQLFWMTS